MRLFISLFKISPSPDVGTVLLRAVQHFLSYCSFLKRRNYFIFTLDKVYWHERL